MSSRAEPVRIGPGQPDQKIERKLSEGETHPYLIALKAGEYLRVVAEQKGVDLALRLFTPGGKQVTEVDSPTGTRGFERVSEIAAATGDYRVDVVGGEGTPPGSYGFQIAEHRVATDADRKRVEGERVFQEGEGLRRERKFEEAIAFYERALGMFKQGGDRVGEADALHRLGWMEDELDHWAEAVELCGRSAELAEEIGNPLLGAESLNRQGRLLGLLGRVGEARTAFEKALRLAREAANPEGEATILQGLGNTYQWTGRLPEALDHYNQALQLFRRQGKRSEEAVTLLSLGDLYLHRGKWLEARDHLDQALRLAEDLDDRRNIAVALETLGALDHREGKLAESRQRLERALSLYNELGHRRGQAQALNSLGTTLLKTGHWDEARRRYEEARGLFRTRGDLQGEATTLSNLGRVAEAQGAVREAVERQQEALAIFERLGDRSGIAFTHFGSAQGWVRLGEPEKALRSLEACLASVESLRTDTRSLDLRAFYLASKQHYWDLYVDVLMTLDQRHPREGYAERALEASERRRARSLLDSLAEVRASAQKEADPELLRQEQEAQDRLHQAERRHRAALRQGESAARIQKIERDIRDGLTALDQARTRIRQATPRLASLESAATLSLEEIREQLLEPNTLLLVYSLGDERSFLWKVTGRTLESHVLPGRERIETAARLVHDLLSHRLQQRRSRLREKAVEDLAALVLGPVEKDLPNFRRLVIVADGALQLVPFAPLPDPAAPPAGNERRPLLIETHEIVYLPSASVVAGLRRERHRLGPWRGERPVAAVVADPVFSADDPRVHHENAAPAPRVDMPGEGLGRALRDLGLERLDRLRSSGSEAEAIAALWPGEVALAVGHEARRKVLEDERWRRALILHFATHSLLDDRQPELSSLVFSQVAPDGKPWPDERLRLHEIYGLELDADLVVLSACQTGVGKELRGEGLQALTRGFMAAGVPAVIVSLWKVEDQATAELMQRFYQAMRQGLRPAEALREAQVAMLRDERWSDPYHWAGFVFQGDFERKPGGGIEASNQGGIDPSRRADSDLPPPKPKPRSKPKSPPKPPTARGLEVPPGLESPALESPVPSNGFELSSYAPAEIGPEAWNTLLAYCFRTGAGQAVAEDSARRLGAGSDRFVQATASTAHSLVPGSEVLIVPELAGCRFNPPRGSFFNLQQPRGDRHAG